VGVLSSALLWLKLSTIGQEHDWMMWLSIKSLTNIYRRARRGWHLHRPHPPSGGLSVSRPLALGVAGLAAGVLSSSSCIQEHLARQSAESTGAARTLASRPATLRVRPRPGRP
jgi:hypothetical protein